MLKKFLTLVEIGSNPQLSKNIEQSRVNSFSTEYAM